MFIYYKLIKLWNFFDRDAIEEENQLYGKIDNAFDYDKAPPRGWQEDKKDFTRKPTYTKYHETGENDPYGVA